jgi:hypothetical protein
MLMDQEPAIELEMPASVSEGEAHPILFGNRRRDDCSAGGVESRFCLRVAR